jgi:hypothetical protein
MTDGNPPFEARGAYAESRTVWEGVERSTDARGLEYKSEFFRMFPRGRVLNHETLMASHKVQYLRCASVPQEFHVLYVRSNSLEFATP